MIRRPPRSTLFPSTTLSRSVPVYPLPPAGYIDSRVSYTVIAPRVILVPREPFGVELPEADLSGVDLDAAPSPLDRKSTRLNSSHANISYAVFCLKKKNHITT